MTRLKCSVFPCLHRFTVIRVCKNAICMEMKGKNENNLYACGCGLQNRAPLKEQTTSVCWESRIRAASGRKEVGYVFRWRDDRSVQRHEAMTVEKQNREKIIWLEKQMRRVWTREIIWKGEVFSVSGCGKGDIRLLRVRKTLCTEDKMNVCKSVLSQVSNMKLKIWALHRRVNAYLRLDGTP